MAKDITLVSLSKSSEQVIETLANTQYYYKKEIINHVLRNILRGWYDYPQKEARDTMIHVDKELMEKADANIKASGYSRSFAFEKVFTERYDDLDFEKSHREDLYFKRDLTPIRVTQSTSDAIARIADRYGVRKTQVTSYILNAIARQDVDVPKKEPATYTVSAYIDLAKQAKSIADENGYKSLSELLDYIIETYGTGIVMQKNK